MPNSLYNELNTGSVNPMFNRIKQFQSMVKGDPKQIIQNMLNTGKISQAQINQYVNQANEIYRMMK